MFLKSRDLKLFFLKYCINLKYSNIQLKTQNVNINRDSLLTKELFFRRDAGVSVAFKHLETS